MQHERSAEDYRTRAIEYRRLADSHEQRGNHRIADDYRQTAAYCDKRAIESRNG